MNSKDLMLIVGAAAAVFFILKYKKTGGGSAVEAGNFVNGIGEIFVKGASNGWRYFTDGTSIAPDGSYYYQGALVYPGN